MNQGPTRQPFTDLCRAPLPHCCEPEALAAHDAAPRMIAADAANTAFRAKPAEVIRLVADPVA